MATPITPKFFADEVVLESIEIKYKPVWDGAAWVIDPANIVVSSVGQLSEDGVYTLRADDQFPATDLPAAGLTALQELYTHVEGKMADKYS